MYVIVTHAKSLMLSVLFSANEREWERELSKFSQSNSESFNDDDAWDPFQWLFTKQNKTFFLLTDKQKFNNANLYFSEKIIKAKWKGLRDNFRIQWKMIPRNENDELMIAPEDFTGTKWQYYRPLLFLADNMGKSRSSYHGYDDNSYELLQQFEPAIEIPSDDEMDKDQKPEISPKLHQRLMEASKRQRDSSSPPSSPVTVQNNHNSNQKLQNLKLPPKLRAIPHLNLMDIHNLISRSTGGETTISPAPLNLNISQQNQQASSSNTSNTSSHPKRRRTDEVTTTGCGGASSNDEFPETSGTSFPTSSNDDDYHFLMSLQPYLSQFTGPQKLRIRMRIQKLIFKELYKDELDE